jgi:hypothetical protein
MIEIWGSSTSIDDESSVLITMIVDLTDEGIADLFIGLEISPMNAG